MATTATKRQKPPETRTDDAPPRWATVGEAIRSVRGAESQKNFCKKLAQYGAAVHWNTLAKYESDEWNVDIDFLAALAAMAEVALEPLIWTRLKSSANDFVVEAVKEGRISLGAGLPHQVMTNDALGEQGFVLIPRYDVQASAGDGREVLEQAEVIDQLAFKSSWVSHRLGLDVRSLVLINAVGDSMENTIHHGDLLLVNTAVTEFRDDAIYVLAREGDLVVKRVQKFLDGHVIIKSDNKQYVEETISKSDMSRVKIAGRVVWHARMV